MTKRPPWLTVRVQSAREAQGMQVVRSVLGRHRLTTVCQGAGCPNAAECWGERTATFMLLGDTCTRACRFCAVQTGNPHGAVDRDEPERLAQAVAELGLAYVVVTSVDRDDLEDGGSSLFARAIRALRERLPQVSVEVLVPDFSGNVEAIRAVAEAGADVVGHNLETVRRLSPAWRDPRASYDQSLAVLARFKALAPRGLVKSSLILGLGETNEEVLQALRDLREAGVDLLTLGQYLRPNRTAGPVARYLSLAEFDQLAGEARSIGFRSVVTGPLVRSSYHAQELRKS